jgi:protein gp37
MLDTTATASFLGSNIWNGRKIRADVEHAYELNDLRRVGQALRYVQADRLANQFKEHTNA